MLIELRANSERFPRNEGFTCRMVKPRLLLTAGVVAASVAAGAVGGSLLFTPSLSGAQDATTEITTMTAPEPGFHGGGPKGAGFLGDSLSVAANALGIDESALRDELKAGKTIADVAKAKNVDVQTVIDALVADAKDKLQQLEDNLSERMTDFVNGKQEFGPDRFGHDGFGLGPGRHLGGVGAGLDVAAKALGIDESALRDELRAGKSIADVAKERKVDVETVIDALVKAADDKIDQAVTDGHLPSDKADEIKSRTKEMITAFVNGQRPARPNGPDGPWGAGAPAPSDTAA